MDSFLYKSIQKVCKALVAMCTWFCKTCCTSTQSLISCSSNCYHWLLWTWHRTTSSLKQRVFKFFTT